MVGSPPGKGMLNLALCVFLAAVSRASAVDLGGAPTSGAWDSDGQPLFIVPADSVLPGTWSVSSGLMYAYQPVVSEVTDAGSVEAAALLGSVWRPYVGGAWAPWTRVGFNVAAPFRAAATWDGQSAGSSSGDTRFVVPIRLGLQPIAVVLSPGLILPFGEAETLGGNPNTAFSLGSSAAWVGDRFRLDAGLGFEWMDADIGGGDVVSDLDRPLTTRGDLGVTVLALPWLGVRGELLLEPGAPSDGSTAGLLGAVSGRWGSFAAEVGAMAPLGGRPGSTWRGLLRLGWSPPPPVVEAAPVVSALPGPYDLRVSARDGDGQGVKAEVAVSGPSPARQFTTDRSGEVVVPLAVGDWTVVVTARGLERQERLIRLGEGRYPSGCMARTGCSRVPSSASRAPKTGRPSRSAPRENGSFSSQMGDGRSRSLRRSRESSSVALSFLANMAVMWRST